QEDGKEEKETVGVAEEKVLEEAQDHPAGRIARHGDGDDPIAVLGPAGDGEVAGEHDLKADAGRGNGEERPHEPEIGLGKLVAAVKVWHGRLLPGRSPSGWSIGTGSPASQRG